MNIEKAVQILMNHNKWRRDNATPSRFNMADPTQLGIAIDTIVYYFESKKRNKIQ